MIERILAIMLSRGLMADEADVRAVIEVMREPTESMLLYGSQSRVVHTIWQAMIDGALLEETP